MKYWQGKIISSLKENEVFVFGSNPEGIHGAGGAKAAVSFGAKFGVGRGLMGKTYALVTKNLKAGYKEESSGIIYTKEGYCSVSPEQIKANIDELYECANKNKDKNFLITFQYETWINGAPKKSLNGYTSEEMFKMFVRDNVPKNIIFHESYMPLLEKSLNSNLVIQEDKEKKEITFTKVSLPYGWLSNMSPHPIVYNETKYLTAEALFQSLRFEGFPDIQKEIEDQKSPMAAKMVAKSNRDILLKKGYQFLGEKDIELMKLCVKLKIEQYPNLANDLLASENVNIIEDCSARPNSSGLFWGAEKTNSGWNGENMLGKIWMEERIKLQNKKEKGYTFFFHLTSPFSNFHPTRFEYKDLTFISNEQFMMYSKAKNFGDEVSAEKIIGINNDPLAKKFINNEINREEITQDKDLSAQWQALMMKAKKLGRGVRNYDEEVWNHRKSKIVLFGARLKFTQNEDLKQILINTGDTFMIEAAPRDSIWGIGLSEYDAKRTPPEKWPGLNLLGKVLDTLKSEFKSELSKRPKP